MAWVAEIMDFRLKNERWECDVDYYDDSNDLIRIPRHFSWELGFDQPSAQSMIVQMGEQIKNMATLNTESIIGLKIPIP